MKVWRMRDSPRPFGLELFAHAVEELAHQHLGHAAQHALADAGYRAADLAVGVDADGCVVPIRLEADARLAADEAGPSAALHVQGVAVRVVPTALVLHPLWLGALGDFLVARDELRRTDAIVVLAGNSPYRAEHAVELYRAGWAPRVLISNELVLSHGVEVSWLALRQAGLVYLDLPDEAVMPLEQVAPRTYPEATESRDLMV